MDAHTYAHYVLYNQVYFAGLIFTVRRSSVTIVKIGPLEIFPHTVYSMEWKLGSVAGAARPHPQQFHSVSHGLDQVWSTGSRNNPTINYTHCYCHNTFMAILPPHLHKNSPHFLCGQSNTTSSHPMLWLYCLSYRSTVSTTALWVILTMWNVLIIPTM